MAIDVSFPLFSFKLKFHVKSNDISQAPRKFAHKLRVQKRNISGAHHDKRKKLNNISLQCHMTIVV